MTVRTRFAPSPTGSLHIGGLRTALYAYFFAKQQGGKMLLRIEDTDKEREVPGATEALVHVLHHMGVAYDEGVMWDGEKQALVSVGDKGPYIQSERLSIYRKHVDQLVAARHAYPCFCSSERLTEMRELQRLNKLPSKYDRTCLYLSKEDVEQKMSSGVPHVIRMKIPEGETVVEDVVYGRTVFANKDLDDQVLLKSDGFPTYHLAVVVDDHLMEITHVLRGEDWLNSTPKHVILYQMFGWEPTVFVHLPNLLGDNKKKLSKRQGDVAVEDFLHRGYLPEALNNFVGTLGFNPKADQELYSIEEFIALFDLNKINRSGAVVNQEKLDWMNGQYIRAMEPGLLTRLLRIVLETDGQTVGDEALFHRVVEVERARLVTLNDVLTIWPRYGTLPEYDPGLLVWKKADLDDAKAQLARVASWLESADETVFETIESLETFVKERVANEGLQTGNVLWPLRVALSGLAQSPSPFELAWVFGKIETLHRIKEALSRAS